MNRGIKVGIAAVGLTLFVVGAFGLSIGGDLGPPRWTTADLPPLPPPADNGWLRVMGPETAMISIELGEAVYPIVQLDSEIFDELEQWQAIVDAEPIIGKVLADPAHIAALAHWSSALEAAHFVDGCSLKTGDFCRYFQGFKLHQLALVEVMALALQKDWPTVNARLARLIEIDQSLLRSNRTFMGAITAVSNTDETLAMTHLLLGRQLAADTEHPTHAQLLRTVADIDFDADILRQGIIGEYVIGRGLLEHVQASGFDDVVSDSWWPPRAMYDGAKTSELLNALSDELMARAQGDEPESETAWTFFDRFFNPMGVRLLHPELTRRGMESTQARIGSSLEHAKRSRSKILNRWGHG